MESSYCKQCALQQRAVTEMTMYRVCGSTLLHVWKENNILWVHTSLSGEIQCIYENRIFCFFAGCVSQLCITVAEPLTQLMDIKQRFISLTVLGAQSPTSGGSLAWILVRAGLEACSSGISWRDTSYISSSKRSWGDVLQFLCLMDLSFCSTF